MAAAPPSRMFKCWKGPSPYKFLPDPADSVAALLGSEEFRFAREDSDFIQGLLVAGTVDGCDIGKLKARVC